MAEEGEEAVEEVEAEVGVAERERVVAVAAAFLKRLRRVAIVEGRMWRGRSCRDGLDKSCRSRDQMWVAAARLVAALLHYEAMC